MYTSPSLSLTHRSLSISARLALMPACSSAIAASAVARSPSSPRTRSVNSWMSVRAEPHWCWTYEGVRGGALGFGLGVNPLTRVCMCVCVYGCVRILFEL